MYTGNRKNHTGRTIELDDLRDFLVKHGLAGDELENLMHKARESGRGGPLFAGQLVRCMFVSHHQLYLVAHKHFFPPRSKQTDDTATVPMLKSAAPVRKQKVLPVQTVPQVIPVSGDVREVEAHLRKLGFSGVVNPRTAVPQPMVPALVTSLNNRRPDGSKIYVHIGKRSVILVSEIVDKLTASLRRPG